ncbi:MAG: hypothetical protein A2664_00400 [Candidatus Taylorbacteria bacterium RIFCSPHIGHO2_01_FULL_46_22b]|uniref:Uncharacterized protein n=1 Tax=Candidatus Taylorbacteria bacterium RIFCSPHIGHO2_01_FULL_46_22b TaxID=1802301 RepID=A0A1G2M4I1_9BACT|nr:MAG: hypothetical protein A2664_00400 [Candidatus Taylorbacteria bacterium RIFCSPHIGHO2_01_FULL_46_22b]
MSEFFFIVAIAGMLIAVLGMAYDRNGVVLIGTILFLVAIIVALWITASQRSTAPRRGVSFSTKLEPPLEFARDSHPPTGEFGLGTTSSILSADQT